MPILTVARRKPESGANRIRQTRDNEQREQPRNQLTESIMDNAERRLEIKSTRFEQGITSEVEWLNEMACFERLNDELG